MPQYGQNSSMSLQEVVDYARTFPELIPVLSVGGFALQPALTIADRVMGEMLSGAMLSEASGEKRKIGPFPWKWNRTYVPPFLTNSWQQDYASVLKNGQPVIVGSNAAPFITNPGFFNQTATALNYLGWIEDAIAIDINNTMQPKPYFGLEVMRQLSPSSQATARPMQVCWMRNSELQYGTWGGDNSTIVGPPNPGPGAVYTNPIGAASAPANPITQIVDPSNNILVLTQYGTCGSTPPDAGPGPLIQPGDTVNDGTCVWTVADPFGQGFRISPRPPQTGVCYQVRTYGQMLPPRFDSNIGFDMNLDPIPDEYGIYFKEGFIAHCYRYSPEARVRAKFDDAWKLWMLSLEEAIGRGDREREGYGFYPDRGAMDTGGMYGQIGPAWPFGPIG